MRTAFITHPDCFDHDTGVGHPETPARLHAIDNQLIATRLFDFLQHLEAPEATLEQLTRVHDSAYIETIAAAEPAAGLFHLDADTLLSPRSLKAARRAAGAAVLATDLVMGEKLDNAFCSVRPPGHHAERRSTMGFCIYNNVAVGAAHALAVHGLSRVAILDFDVHHANGTEDIFKNDPRVLLCSSFQHPFFPYTACEESSDHIVCSPLPATAAGKEFREVVSRKWLPALERFRPQIIFVSAGFDAHVEDDISSISLHESDFRWVTERILEVAAAHADKRIVSTLEGGYELHALGRSVEAHLRVLMGLV